MRLTDCITRSLKRGISPQCLMATYSTSNNDSCAMSLLLLPLLYLELASHFLPAPTAGGGRR